MAANCHSRDLNEKKPTGPLPRRWINDVELAGYLGVSVATTRRWRLHHTGPPFTKIGSSVRYALDEVDRWMSKQPRGGSVEPAARSNLYSAKFFKESET